MEISLLRGERHNIMIHDKGKKLDFATCRRKKFTKFKPHVILDAVRKFTEYKQPTSLHFKCPTWAENMYRDLASEIMMRDNRIGTKVEPIDEPTTYEKGCLAARRAFIAKRKI